MIADFLGREERIALRLKSLYKSYGYEEYRLPGFDEYSLYAENESFLAEKDVVAFNAGGKLLALRPDVTLSIVKNLPVAGTRKLFYDETVYRKSSVGFSDVRQIGVEVIGKVDFVARAEICSLMFATLDCVESDFVIDASHMGVIVKALKFMRLSAEGEDFAVKCLREKNAHDFARFAKERDIEPAAAAAFEKLISLPADPLTALSVLRGIAETLDISAEIAELEEMINLSGGRAEIDFSIVGDAEYYNGLIFKGYVSGMPRAVLSGGRYDKLLTKFAKRAQAVGFALYLGELGKYLEAVPDMPEIAVLYNDSSAENAFSAAQKLRGEGRRVLLCRELPDNFGGEIISAEADK